MRKHDCVSNIIHFFNSECYICFLTSSVTLQNNPFNGRCHEMRHSCALDRRKQPQQNHIAIESSVSTEFRNGVGSEDGLIIHFNVNPTFDNGSHVGTMKCIQIASAVLDGPIASHQLVSEVNADFRNVVISGNDQSPDEVVSAVASGFETRDLGSSDDDWFAQVFQHE